VGGVLWLTLPAVYVAASNLALVPLTGQNMPFLGLNSWADVILGSGLATGIVFSLAGLREREGRGEAGRPPSGRELRSSTGAAGVDEGGANRDRG
jgi:hypothetical protein